MSSCFSVPLWTSIAFKLIKYEPREAGEGSSALGSLQFKVHSQRRDILSDMMHVNVALILCKVIRLCGVQLYYINATGVGGLDVISLDHVRCTSH